MPTDMHLPQEVRKTLSRLLGDLFGPSAQQTGEWLADRVRFYRYKSAARTLERAKAISRKLKIKPREVPIRFLVPFLEKCSLEDEDSDLTETWAKLLISASKDDGSRHPLYVDILSRLSATDVRALKSIWERVDPSVFQTMASYYQVYGIDYSIESRIKSDGFVGQASLSYFDAGSEKYGRSLLYLVGGPDGPTGIEEQLLVDAKRSKRFAPRGQSAVLSSAVVLDREGLVSLKSVSGKRGRQRWVVVWCELTPLGFDFATACEAGKRPNAKSHRPTRQ